MKRIDFSSRLIFAGALCAALASAQTAINPGIDFPPDSPVGLLAADFPNSTATPRGGAEFLGVKAALSLRNASQKRINAVVLVVTAQEVTPGGKASVRVDSLNVAPGEPFPPIHIDVTLLRPLGAASGSSLKVKLDGVLFDDLSFYGPDALHSRQSMTTAELEARRDRKYFKTLLETAGGEVLRKEILESIARQAERPQGGVAMVPGRATNTDPERDVQFAFLEMPESPVEPLSGTARIAGNEARAPMLRIRNRSNRAVQHVDIGWVVKDQRGEYLAASIPADLKLAPNQTGQVAEDGTLRFPERTSIQTMSAFVQSVKYEDGGYWIPSRTALDAPKLRSVVAPSPEEQRLSQIYRKKGLPALIDELKKF